MTAVSSAPAAALDPSNGAGQNFDIDRYRGFNTHVAPHVRCQRRTPLARMRPSAPAPRRPRMRDRYPWPGERGPWTGANQRDRKLDLLSDCVFGRRDHDVS